jgi:hypothetical protein
MKTLKEVVDYVMNLAGDEIREAIFKEDMTKDKISALAHHTLGRHLRNNLNLWQDSSADLREDIWNSLTPAKQKFYRDWWNGKGDFEGRTMHADDASGTILDAVMDRIIAMKAAGK